MGLWDYCNIDVHACQNTCSFTSVTNHEVSYSVCFIRTKMAQLYVQDRGHIQETKA